MQEHDDYADPAPPRTRASRLLIALMVVMGLLAVAAAGWIGLNEFLSDCSKPAP